MLNLISPVNSVLLWYSQPIVCWLYQGWECMGWSDLTELEEIELDRATYEGI